jgi:hypothetical protein
MSRIAERIVRLAALTLPERVRARHREEWLADVASAHELGMRASQVALGAILFTATLDRDAPEISGLPHSAAKVRRLRWALVSLASSIVLLVGTVLIGGYDPVTRPAIPAVEALLVAADLLLPIMTTTLVAVGLIELWRIAAGGTRLDGATAFLTSLVVASIIAASLDPSLWLPMMTVAALALVAAGICALISWLSGSSAVPETTPLRPTTVETVTRGRIPAIAIGTVTLFGLIAVGAVESLVWMPLAMAPDYTLQQIYAMLGDAGGTTLDIVMVAVWAGFWVSAIIVAAVLGLRAVLRGRGIRLRTIITIALAFASAIVFFQFWAGFSIGSSVSDTIPPYSGGISPVGYLYALAGQLSLVAVIFLWLAPTRRGRLVAPHGTGSLAAV